MASGLFNLKQVNQAISQGAWSGYIAPRWVEYLVVAGGGGGGTTGGGGGAGGLLTGIVTVATGASYTVTVGTGGAGSTNFNATGASGVASVFGSISATGGGGAGSNAPVSGVAGGSGGGAGSSGFLGTGGQAVSGQGNTGGLNNISASNYGAGGGGGAGTAGLNGLSSAGGNGGAGIASAISGLVSTYAGGGGGGSQGGTAGVGGVGGGGSGTNSLTTGAAGGGNTGGGGGGGGYSSATYGNGGNGGSGIVVVRYPGSVQFFTGGTLSYANGYMIHTFFANGTLAPTTPTPYVTDYQISRSLRFNSADSAYLNRTPASAGSRTTWTWSAWIKRGLLGSPTKELFTASTGGEIFIGTNDTLSIYDNATTYLATTQVFRDPSAWYHIVVVWDTTQATSTNRIKFYVNGTQVTAFGTSTYPAQNTTSSFNNNTLHNLGEYFGGGSFYFDGYMTEVNFIDGQALTPSSFGYTNPATGVWSPLKFVGTYGTNGFYLNFSDNSNTTAATLGADYSGNGNNWTPNNFSVTAGAGNDSLVDSPTSYGVDTGVGGTVRGNYATLNPLVGLTGTRAFSNGNLQVSVTTDNVNTFATFAVPSSGKWYWEYQITTITVAPMGGVITGNESALSSPSVVYRTNGNKIVDNVQTSYGATYTTTDIIGVAADVDGGTITFYKNGTSQGAITYATGGLFPAVRSNAQPDAFTMNFGQRAFANTAPSGFKALCTQNLPTPTIGATTATTADKYFGINLWTGNGTSQTLTNSGGFQPDWVWLKSRSSGTNFHNLYDVLRGATKYLFSNSTSAEGTNAQALTAFTSTGFSVGNDNDVNQSSSTYVGWQWKANGSGSSNTAGSITSTVSASTTSGFSVVTFTAPSSGSGTVGHGLGVAPNMMIWKSRSNADSWTTYHSSLGGSSALFLNSTNASFGLTWGTINSTLFTADTSQNCTASRTYVAYCFAEVAGYSKFGSYTGNSSTDGTFVYLGFRPAYMMIKATNAVEDWVIMDVARSPYNGVNLWLNAEDSSADATLTPPQFDFNSNGMKLRGTSSTVNATGTTYIYMAFASNPFKTSLAR